MPNDPQDMWQHVQKAGPGGCWTWTGNISIQGYGRFCVNYRGYRAHRLAYELLVGPIPRGLVLDHLCRNKLCVNPAHLEPVTQRENVLRGEGISAREARQTHCFRGHPFTGLDIRGHRTCHVCGRIRASITYQRRKAAMA